MKYIKKSKIKFGKGGFYMDKRSSVIVIPKGAFYARDINGGINNLKNFFEIDDDLIEKAREAARSIYQNEESVSPSLSSASEYVSPQASSAFIPFGCQWYEADPERYAVELAEMESRGFDRIDFYDGRIGFKKIDNEKMIKITVICDWLYPLKPPAVYISTSGPELKIKKNADGSLALLSKYMLWKADMAACTMIDYLEEKLEMLKDLRDEDEEFGPAEYEKAEVSDAIENPVREAFAGGVNEIDVIEKESCGYVNNDEEWNDGEEKDDDDEKSENGTGQILRVI